MIPYQATVTVTVTVTRTERVARASMSSDSSDSRDNKVFKLRSRRYFPMWKQKTLAAASSKGYEKYLLQAITIHSEVDIDAKEAQYINEADDGRRRVLKGELAKMKRERKKSLEAAEMLTNSIRSKDLKMLVKCKMDPKKMFETLFQEKSTRNWYCGFYSKFTQKTYQQ